MAQTLDTTTQFHGSEPGPSEGRHQEIRHPPNEDLPPLNLKLRKSQRQPTFCSLPAKIEEEEKPRQKIQAAHSHPQIPNIRGGNHRETVLEPPGKKRQVETDVDDFSSSQTEVPARGEVQDPNIEVSSQSLSEAVGAQSQDDLYQSHQVANIEFSSQSLSEAVGAQSQDDLYQSHQVANIEFSSQSSSEAVGAQSLDDLYQSHHEHNQAFRVLSHHLEVEQCLNSDAYQEVNVRYNREGGSAHQEHALEDRFFSFKLGDFHVYGVFDGHDGSRASEFATEHIPRFLGSRLGKTEMTDEEIQSALKFAIEKVDEEFFSQLSGLIAERMSLQFEMEGMTSYQAYQTFPSKVARLQKLTDEISGGSTVVIAIIYADKLFVANVGDARVILGKRGKEGEIESIQISVDHDTSNKDELKRLERLGLNVKDISRSGRIGSQQNTRSIGDYSAKQGYKQFDILSSASGPPVIAEPFVSDVISLDDKCLFIALMTDGVYKSVEESAEEEKPENGNSYVAKEIASKMLKSYSKLKTNSLTNVCQKVVERIAARHEDAFYRLKRQECRKRDDMTLLVRSFPENVKAFFGRKL